MKSYRFVGMVAPTCLVADLGMSIPYGVEVSIPAEASNTSKDLWVAVNTGKIQRLGPSTIHRETKSPDSSPTLPSPPITVTAQGVGSSQVLEAILAEQVKISREILRAQIETNDILNQILSAARSGKMSFQDHEGQGSNTVADNNSSQTPIFIPSLSMVAPSINLPVKTEDRKDDLLSSRAERIRKSKNETPA